MDADARAGDAAGRTCAHPTRGGLPWARQAAATAPPIPPPRRAASLWKKVPHTSNMGPTARAARPPPAHAAIHADAAAPSVPLTPASPAAGPTGWRKRAAPPRTAALRSRAAESTRRASSPAHAAYTPMMPLLCPVLQSSVPLTPAGAEKAHAAADGSGAYQMADRRSGKHARRVLPPRTPPYMPMLPRTPSRSRQPAQQQVPQAGGSGLRRRGLRRFDHAQRKARAAPHTCRCCRALRPPSRQWALKKHMPQPMVRAHIK